MSGSTRSPGGSGLAPGGGGGAAPMVGARSASSMRGPRTSPDSTGTFGRASYVRAAVRLLVPTVALSATIRHRSPCLTILPVIENGPVVGSVTPRGSPMAPSDGPLTLYSPLRPLSLSTSETVPRKRSEARPALTSSAMGVGGALADEASSGMAPAAVSRTATLIPR